MAKIYIGFSKPTKWKIFAKAIMIGYGIPYDHVYVRFHSDRYDRELIYQASKSMVNFMGIEVFKADNIIVREFEIDIPDENLNKLIQFAIDNAGKPYGVKQAFGMALVRIAQLCGKKIKNPFRDGGNTYVCSEMGAYILEHFVGDIVPRDIDDITPEDLFNYLEKLEAAGAIIGIQDIA